MILLQSQPWTNVSATNNYVTYQTLQPGDSLPRVNPSSPNSCLVVGASISVPSALIGLGAVSPYCRVSHFGSDNSNSSAAWSDQSWTLYNSSSPHTADEGLNLVVRTPTLTPGASVTFGWVYSFDVIGSPFPNALSAMWIQEPADTATGTACVFSVVVNTSVNSVSSVSFVLLYQTATVIQIGAVSTPAPPFGNGLALYSLTYNTTSIPSGDGYVVRHLLTKNPCYSHKM